jgi:hypothetical protein
MRHVQLIAISGSIGAALFVSIGSPLTKAGPLGLLIGVSVWSFVVWTASNCLIEMTTLLPVDGGFITFTGRLVDGSFGMAVGWNVSETWYTSLILVPHYAMGTHLLRIQRHECDHILLDTHPFSGHRHISRYRSPGRGQPMVGTMVRRSRILDEYHEGLIDFRPDHVHFYHDGRRVSRALEYSTLTSETRFEMCTASATGRIPGLSPASRAPNWSLKEYSTASRGPHLRKSKKSESA